MFGFLSWSEDRAEGFFESQAETLKSILKMLSGVIRKVNYVNYA